jgi:hypothetical protein
MIAPSVVKVPSVLAVALVVCFVGCDGTLNSAGTGGQPGGDSAGTGGAAGTGGNTNAPSAGTGGSTGGGVVTPTAHCPGGDTPSPVDPAGNEWFCQGTIFHRASSNDCLPWVPTDNQIPPTQLGDQCVRDAECVAKSYGRCVNNRGSGGGTGNSCFYGCVTDQDCGAAGVCRCSTGGGGFCVAANCKTDDECAAGKLCVLAAPSACFGQYVFTCETARDECSIRVPTCSCRWSGDHLACFDSCPIP